MSNLNENLQDFKFQYIEIYGNCNQVKDPVKLSSGCEMIQFKLSKTINSSDDQPFFHMCFNELGEYKIYSNGICDYLIFHLSDSK